jgi:hypothetical protein
MLRIRKVLACLAVIVALVPGFVLAQSQATTGVIEGTVSDANGAPLPGATVAMKNTDTNFEKSAITGPDGRFRGVLLPLGPYKVTVTLSGFSTLVRDGLTLSVGQTINLPFTLNLSQRSEQVVVTGAAPLVETTRAEGSTDINSAAIQGLPNNGRNFLDFVKLTPGVTIVQGPDGDELSINGQKGINNNVSVDGADYNNPFFGEQRGGQRPAFTFNLDAVKEVVVVSDGANAEFGRSNSGFVNVVTKSGTNAIHGSAHGYFKDSSYSSAPTNRDGSTGIKNPSNQQQAGFTLGGPFVQDKLFFFTAFDYQRGRSTKQNDPSRIDPLLVQYFASVGAPNENAPISRTNDAKVFLGKFDWQANEKNLLSLKYNYTWSEQANGTFDVDPWGASANAVEQDDSNAGSGSLVSTFTSNLVNEFRFQWAREDRPRPYSGPTASTGRPFPDTGIDFGGQYRFGMPFFIPVDDHDTRLQLVENATYLTGAHTIKGGLEFNRVNTAQTFRGFANGRYIFDSVAGFLAFTKNNLFVECSDGSSSPSGNCPAGTSITGPVELYLQNVPGAGLTVDQAGTQDIVQYMYGAFLQDKWQPSPNLTVQFGLRWDAQIEPDPITPASQVFFSKFIGTTSKGQAFPSDGNIPSDKAMWQPRLGITWDPKGDGKTVIRANGGIFDGLVPGLNLASTRSTNGNLSYNAFRASFLTPFGLPVPAYPNVIPLSQLPTVPDHPDVYVFDKDFVNPRTYSASIGFEHELATDLAVSLKYNIAHTVHITRFVNSNDPLFGSPWSTGLGADGTNGVGVLWTVKSTAKSLYNGITLGIEKRFSNNFAFQGYYTLSWDKSDDDNERDPFTLQYAKVTNLDAEYGYSNRDQRHRVNAIVLWKAPGAINVNARFSYRSAQPLDVNAAGIPVNTPQDRINADGSVTERNQGRKDNQFSSLDLRISRAFMFGNVMVEPIAEVFNLFNSKNLKQPGVPNLLFNFDGTVQSGLGDPLQAQFGVRIVF